MLGITRDLRALECEEEPDVSPPVPDKKVQWEHTNALLFGVALPAFMILCAGLINFNSLLHMVVRRPVETLVEIAFVVAIPILNHRLWTAFARCDGRHPLRVGIYGGVAVTVSALIFGIAAACMAAGFPTIDEFGASHGQDYMFVAFAAFSSLAVGVVCLELIRRTKLTKAARIRTVLYSLAGVALTLVAAFACEVQSVRLRLAERTASVSTSSEERDAALALLRDSNPDHDLWMDCADATTAGLAGLFIKFDGPTRARMYFAAAGKPYVDARAGDVEKLTDDSLSRHVIGQKLPNLSLRRSAITGFVHSDALVSTLDWTFVFKNENYQGQEARAEIALPPGAVVSGLTLWINGEPREAAFGNATTVSNAYRGINMQKRDPALITDLGRGRVLLQCSPVPARGEAKVKVQVTAPLKLDNLQEASVVLPRFINSNFTVAGDHALRLRSNHEFLTNFPGVRTQPTDQNDFLIIGNLKDNDLSGTGVAVRVEHDPKVKSVVVEDKNPRAAATYVTSIVNESLALAPERVVVVVDGSQALASYKKEILEALASIPHTIPTTVLVASQTDEAPRPVALQDFLDNGRNLKFAGGQDNLEALIKAAELAGETKRSAVLWLHGPQPSFNREMYILAPYVGKPNFYELPLDDGWTDTSEFLNNHKEIGPFTPIVRNASVKEDLQRFFSQWKPGAKSYKVARVHTFLPPAPVHLNKDPDLIRAVSCLAVNTECRKLLARGKVNETIDLATAYRIINKCTGAVVLERTGDYLRYGLKDPNAEPGDEVALNSRAANGSTVTGNDATVIRGVNTAGTVRVNNLANLEALLNLIANGTELLGVVFGLVQIFRAFGRKPAEGDFGIKYNTKFFASVFYGVTMILGGLAVPGVINWLVASARDANLFS